MPARVSPALRLTATQVAEYYGRLLSWLVNGEFVDEFGVTHHDILFSEKDDKIYCVLEAPNVEAIHKHHAKAGIKCDWVHEVKSTRE